MGQFGPPNDENGLAHTKTGHRRQPATRQFVLHNNNRKRLDDEIFTRPTQKKIKPFPHGELRPAKVILHPFQGQAPGPSALTPAARQRFYRQVERLHALGPRPVGELLQEIIVHFPDDGFVSSRLEVFADMSAATILAFGGDQFPPIPIHSVKS